MVNNEMLLKIRDHRIHVKNVIIQTFRRIAKANAYPHLKM